MRKCRAMFVAGAIFTFTTSILGFDTKWHADTTRVAMDQNGFSPDARLLCSSRTI